MRSLRRATKYRHPAHPDAVNVLPDAEIDFAPLRDRLVAADAGKADLHRRDYADQVQKITAQFRGKSELLVLHALTISYLRRQTPHTAHAQHLFLRLWTEESDFLRLKLPLRWKVSALQTFHDHGDTDSQKLVGAVGFTYANLIKAYEAERSLYEITPLEPAPGPLACRGFPALNGFTPGDDLLRNINIMMMAVALQDPIAGPILEDVITVTARQKTIFQRVDAQRARSPYRERSRFFGAFGDELAAPTEDDADPADGLAD